MKKCLHFLQNTNAGRQRQWGAPETTEWGTPPEPPTVRCTPWLCDICQTHFELSLHGVYNGP
jgi:hypothetical protein